MKVIFSLTAAGLVIWLIFSINSLQEWKYLVNLLGVWLVLCGLLMSLYNFWMVRASSAGASRTGKFLKVFMPSRFGERIDTQITRHFEDGILEGLILSSVGSLVSGLSEQIGSILSCLP